MEQLRKKIVITLLTLSVFLMSFVAPYQESMLFCKTIQCYAISPTTALSLELLLDMLFGVGVTAGGNSISDEYSVWQSDTGKNTVEDIDALEAKVRKEYEMLVTTRSGDATTEVQSYLDNYFTLNDDGTYTPADEIVQDGKLIIPSSVVKNSADLIENLQPIAVYTETCTSSLSDYVTDYVPFGSCSNGLIQSDADRNLVDIYSAESIQEILVNGLGIEYEKYAYLAYFSNEFYTSYTVPFGCTYINSDVSVAYDSDVTYTLKRGIYKTEDFKTFLDGLGKGELYSGIDELNEKRMTSYEIYGYSAGSIKSCKVLNSANVPLFFDDSPYHLMCKDTGAPVQNRVAIQNDTNFVSLSIVPDLSNLGNALSYSLTAIGTDITQSIFVKTADTVEQDITVDLTDENITAISDATSLDDVINAVDASSAELTSIRDGISDTNEKLEDTNAELSGISGILSSIYNLLAGDSSGTLFDFVAAISTTVFSIFTILEDIASNVLILSDISKIIGNISTYVVALPQNIADAISDTFPALAQDIADAISDTFPFGAQDIADAISDTFPFDAQDIADAISNTFPFDAQDIADAISDVYPYVDIKEIIDGLAIPSAQDIADAVSRTLPSAQDIADKLNLPFELANVIAAIQSLPLAIAQELAKILDLSIDFPLEDLKSITWSVSIPGLLELIVEAVKEAIIALIVPDEMVVSSKLGNIKTAFDDKFASLEYPFEVLKDLFNFLMTAETGDFIIKLPAIEVLGNTISDEYSFNVSAFFKKYSEWYNWYIVVTDLVILSFFLRYMGKKLDEIFKN